VAQKKKLLTGAAPNCLICGTDEITQNIREAVATALAPIAPTARNNKSDKGGSQ
jgi:hypothetical protein